MSLLTRIRRLQHAAPRPLSDALQSMASDPVQLARAAGWVPDDWQADVLRSTAPRILLNCCRQSGKSTVAATLAVHRAVFHPDSLVLMLSPSLRQSSELFKKAIATYRDLGRPVSADTENRLSLELSNGSRIVSLPGKEATVRGFSGVALLLVDEGSRVPDEMMAAVRPMLAVSGGRLIGLSTPWGARGWWHAAWTEGGDSWERYLVDAFQVARISADFLEAERAALGNLWFQSEYLCRFVDTEDSVFRSEDIHAALDSTIAPLWGAA